jgi:hypothetical protein
VEQNGELSVGISPKDFQGKTFWGSCYSQMISINFMGWASDEELERHIEQLKSN